MEITMGHSSERKKIVPQLRPRIDNYNKHFNGMMLVREVGDTTIQVLEWMATFKLIRNEFECPDCKVAMLLIHDSAEGDEYVWCCKTCSSTRSVREGSVFTCSELSLEYLVYFFYSWASELKSFFNYFVRGSNKSKDIQTERYLSSVCRDICEHWLEENPSVIGGIGEDGRCKVVMIGESEYFYRKHNKGLWQEGHWVFGGVENKTGKCFFVEVPDRLEATLSNLIQKFILPGTIIVSDGWASYANIQAIEGGNYKHKIDRSMRQNIWIWAKRHLRQRRGYTDQTFPSYLHELFWRDAFKDTSMFLTFVSCVGNVTNCNQNDALQN